MAGDKKLGPPVEPEPPTHCRRGHQLGPNRVHIAWWPCQCPGALAGGHRLYCCLECDDKRIAGPEHVEPGEFGTALAN